MESISNSIEAGQSLIVLLKDAEECIGSVITSLNTEHQSNAMHFALVVQKRLQIVNDTLEEMLEESLDDTPTSLAGAVEQAGIYFPDGEG